MTVVYGDLAITWLGYATVRFEMDDTVAYVDPGRYGVLDEYEATDGDLVCVTHDHHYDPDGIARVARTDATVLVYESVDADRIDRDVRHVDDLQYAVRRVDDEADLAIGEVIVSTVPAYNDPAGPRTISDGDPIHPEGFGCGFQLTFQTGRWAPSVFWPGDTDVLPGHEALSVDVFVPPIGGSLTMNRHEAADLAVAMRPGLVVPVHYDTFPAIDADASAFAADVAGRGVPVVLDE